MSFFPRLPKTFLLILAVIFAYFYIAHKYLTSTEPAVPVITNLKYISNMLIITFLITASLNHLSRVGATVKSNHVINNKSHFLS